MPHTDGPLATGAGATPPPERAIRCEMETGSLRVSWRETIAVDAGETVPIFGFAERDNPRRAFLFVSRVLGRHVPVRPATVRSAFTRLADTVPDDLPGPVLVTGMAETAVGLGAGVHDAYLARTAREDVTYLSSTRARLDAPLLAEFSETHSHASAHRLYRPQHARERTLLEGARSLVMVDDEASSGATFAHLAAALAAAGLDRLARVHTAVLTDWSDGRAAASLERDGVTVSRSALLHGRHEWVARENAPRRTLPDADTVREPAVRPIRRADDARLGRARRSDRGCPPALLERLAGDTAPVLVLGSGEHVWEPFLVAESIERTGREVRFGATTRSPIRPGHAIRRGYAFADHEGLGITNYLYNVDPDAYARIVLCVDTALEAIDPALLGALGADVLVGETLHTREELAERVRAVPPPRAFVATDEPPTAQP